MRREIAGPITGGFLVLGGGIAITSPWPLDATGLWLSTIALVVLVLILVAHVCAAGRRRP